MQVLSHQHRGEKSIGSIACPVALSSIFTEWANLKWGCLQWRMCETAPRILQHERAPWQLLSGFSPTNHRDCHFRDELHEKWLFSESLARGVLQACILYYKPCSTRYKLAKPPAARQRGTGMHFAFGLGSFKICTNGKWPRYSILNLPKLERWRHPLFSVPVYNLLEQSLSRVQIWTFHFALKTSFSSGFGHGSWTLSREMPLPNPLMHCLPSLSDPASVADSRRARFALMRAGCFPGRVALQVHFHQQSRECIFCILKSGLHILYIVHIRFAYFAYCRQYTGITGKPAYCCILFCIFYCILCISNLFS